jgi:phosphopantetheine adenylyltransferase
MEQYGIELITVEIKRLDLPDDNKNAVYERMISERNNIAASYIAEGEAEATKIRTQTDYADGTQSLLEETLTLDDQNRVIYDESYWDGETVFVVGSKQYRHVSSSLVRELASLGQNFDEYVPENCLEEIKKYLVG